MRCFVFLILFAATAQAAPDQAAPERWAATAGLGLTHWSYEYEDTDSPWGLSLVLDGGYRVLPRLTVGLHLGLSRSSGTKSDGYENGIFYTTSYGYFPLDLGVTARLAVSKNIWLAPWLGVQWVANSEHTPAEHRFGLGYGATLGADLTTSGTHPIGAFVAVMQSAHFYAYRSVTLGASYQF